MGTRLYSMQPTIVRGNEVNRDSDERHSTPSRWTTGSDAESPVSAKEDRLPEKNTGRLCARKVYPELHSRASGKCSQHA
ncbi:unnamed protein product [Ectocarpus sp. CCAP 1310/34]|nr:unnamed protein product [Ectocarpus sp. CCAP 1310/34]